MKRITLIMSASLILSLLLIGVVSAAETDIPNLIGVWTVTENEGDSMLTNYTNTSPEMISKVNIVIETQNGQVFEGYTERLMGTGNNESVIKEGMAGVINDDMTHAYIKQFNEGVSFADITSPDTITIYSLFDMSPLNAENPGVARLVLTRENSV